MRIVIEIDSDNKAEITKGASGENSFNQSSASSATDAGAARIPEPETIPVTSASFLKDDSTAAARNNQSKAIDAGAFNGGGGTDDNNSSSSSSEQQLSTGSANNAGRAKPAQENNQVDQQSQQGETNFIDKENAMSAGGFQGEENT